MKILLLGKNGQVGWELSRSLMPLGELVALDRSQCDLAQPQTIPSIIQSIRPDVIVNAAAYTAVDKAESEPDLANTINHISVGVIAEEAKKLDALLIHYSTDYVFDGTKKEPYTEEDDPNPQSVYGKTKLLGEKAIQKSGCKHLIFRTSWVFAARGSNFVKTMLRLAAERDELKVVADQFGAPTSAELIADVTALALQQVARSTDFNSQIEEIYHLTSAGKVSWFEFAVAVLEFSASMGHELKVLPNAVEAISSDDFPTLAKRPKYSVLSSKKLSVDFSIPLVPWQSYAARSVAEILSD